MQRIVSVNQLYSSFEKLTDIALEIMLMAGLIAK